MLCFTPANYQFGTWVVGVACFGDQRDLDPVDESGLLPLFGPASMRLP